MQNTWVDIREPYTDKLLMRYDPARDIIEVQRRGIKTLVDLSQYKAPAAKGNGFERHGTPAKAVAD